MPPSCCFPRRLRCHGSANFRGLWSACSLLAFLLSRFASRRNSPASRRTTLKVVLFVLTTAMEKQMLAGLQAMGIHPFPLCILVQLPNMSHELLRQSLGGMLCW